MNHAVIPLHRSQFRIALADPCFQVTTRGANRFNLSGEVSTDPSVEMTLDTPDDSIDIALAKRSTPDEVVTKLRRALPRDVHMTQSPAANGVEVTFQEVVVPAAKPPRFRVLTTDMLQRVKQLDENRVEFIGSCGADTLLTMLVDARRLTIAIPRGASAAATAVRVGSSMPHGYRALVEDTVVSVWKDADFFTMVA